MVLLAQWAKYRYWGVLSVALLFVLGFTRCSSKEGSMKEPPMSKVEHGFFRPIKAEYNCKIKRTQSLDSAKVDTKYKVLLLEFPEAQYDRGDSYLEQEAHRIGLRMKHQLFPKLDKDYKTVIIGFHVKGKGLKEFVFQL